MHENDLNTLFLGDLAKWLREHQYKIVTATYAFADPTLADPKTHSDEWPFSMHRLRSFAKNQNYPGVTVSVWEDETSIENYFNDNIRNQ
jgi:hypothetical protein